MNLLTKYFSDFSEKQLSQFAALENLYREWNSKINVISRKDIDSLYEKHVLHSLSIAAVFDLQKGMEIIDIGTGGGFPGIPLAIYFPEVKFHLVDSIAKKLKVVQVIANEINLDNVTTQHIRAEEIRNRKFDLAVSRAVAPLKDLWKWSKLILKTRINPPNFQSQNPDSHIQPGLICLKGGELASEIHESQTRPMVYDISTIFSESFFKEKYILYIQK